MRLFTAIELSDEVKAMLGDMRRSLSSFDRTVRWVNADQMHLTIKFLGEVDDARVGGISKATAQIATDSSPFELEIGGTGCFPPEGKVRVVWVGVGEPSGALAACNRACEEKYADLGIARERRDYSPHLTLGRVRDDRTNDGLRVGVERVSLAARRQPVDRIVLVQSVLTPRGARYTVVSRHGLGGAPRRT
ncbi:MAG: RNA 2',3'-cyclic phosphodiesterase [bacterium]|nr:RNA 2',3'-cyclic phosphodiesterase [bacterium]